MHADTYIPRRLDDQWKIGFWDVDVAAPLLFGLFMGYMSGSKFSFALCLAAGFLTSRAIARIKADKHPAFAVHWLYWHPVSYTHLDVYKRQPTTSGSCRSTAPTFPSWRGMASARRSSTTLARTSTSARGCWPTHSLGTAPPGMPSAPTTPPAASSRARPARRRVPPTPGTVSYTHLDHAQPIGMKPATCLRIA